MPQLSKQTTARFFDHTIRQVVQSRALVFNPVASFHALMKAPQQRTVEEFQASVDYAAKCIQFFRQLPLIATKPLLERSTPHVMPANSVIIREGNLGTNVYIIVQGECVVHRLGYPAPRSLGAHDVNRMNFGHPVTVLGPGDSFGESATEHRNNDMNNDDHPQKINHAKNNARNASVVTTTECHLLVIDAVTYNNLVVSHGYHLSRVLNTCTILATPPMNRLKRYTIHV